MSTAVLTGPYGPRSTWEELDADNRRLHAIKRAWQRHGLACSVADIRAAEVLIRAGKAEHLAEQPHHAGAWRVGLKHKTVVVVFSTRLDAIVTVLPSTPRKVGLVGKWGKS